FICLVIGDEILNGKVEEINSRLVCTTAPSLGLKLRKISVVPDNIDIIAKEAREFMHNFDIVLTSGGIGPTHDDMTFEGLAKALGQKTFTHPELMHVVENFFGFDSTVNPSDPRIRLSQVPVSSELVYGIDYSTGRHCNYPVVKVRNIYALPGIPRLFHTAFEIIKEHLRDPRIRFHSRSLYVTQEETQIAVFLSGLAEKYNEALSVGSYPTIDNNYYRVRVVLDSLDEKILAVAFQEAKEYFASDTVAYEPDPVANAKEAVYSLLRDGTVFSGRVAKAIGIIEAALKQFT
ncbi:Flavin adenine dinucleotide synthetase 1, partial [Paragonimus heterotremus]